MPDLRLNHEIGCAKSERKKDRKGREGREVEPLSIMWSGKLRVAACARKRERGRIAHERAISKVAPAKVLVTAHARHIEPPPPPPL